MILTHHLHFMIFILLSLLVSCLRHLLRVIIILCLRLIIIPMPMIKYEGKYLHFFRRGLLFFIMSWLLVHFRCVFVDLDTTEDVIEIVINILGFVLWLVFILLFWWLFRGFLLWFFRLFWFFWLFGLFGFLWLLGWFGLFLLFFFWFWPLFWLFSRLLFFRGFCWLFWGCFLCWRGRLLLWRFWSFCFFCGFCWTFRFFLAFTFTFFFLFRFWSFGLFLDLLSLFLLLPFLAFCSFFALRCWLFLDRFRLFFGFLGRLCLDFRWTSFLSTFNFFSWGAFLLLTFFLYWLFACFFGWTFWDRWSIFSLGILSLNRSVFSASSRAGVSFWLLDYFLGVFVFFLSGLSVGVFHFTSTGHSNF